MTEAGLGLTSSLSEQALGYIEKRRALASFLRGWSISPRTEGSWVGLPVKGKYRGCRFGPQFSHSLPPPFLHPTLSKHQWEKVAWGEDEQQQKREASPTP